MRSSLTLGCVFLGSLCWAQAPDVRVKLDATLDYRTQAGQATILRPYSFDGRPSLVAVTINMEGGFRGFVSERLVRLPSDPDPSLLDEYYIEDPGLWRVGKQLIPFGAGRVIRESAFGVRGDTNLIFQGLPVAVMAFDGGSGLIRGVDTRIGSRVGLSVFLGQHFGISSGSLTQIREPEESPGNGHGYKTAFALDGSRRWGKFEVKGEFVALGQGETSSDKDINLADGTLSYMPSRSATFVGGYTWRSQDARQYLRLGAILPVSRGVQFEPWIRFRNNALWDVNLQLRVRL